MLGLKPYEIILIIFVILLLFGGKKIPEMMKGVGRGVKSFKEGLSGEDKKEKEKEEVVEKKEEE